MKWRELAGRKLEIQYRPPFPGFEHLQGSFYCTSCDKIVGAKEKTAYNHSYKHHRGLRTVITGPVPGAKRARKTIPPPREKSEKRKQERHERRVQKLQVSGHSEGGVKAVFVGDYGPPLVLPGPEWPLFFGASAHGKSI